MHSQRPERLRLAGQPRQNITIGAAGAPPKSRRQRVKETLQKRVDRAIEDIAALEKANNTAVYDLRPIEKSRLIDALIAAVERLKYALNHPNQPTRAVAIFDQDDDE